MFHQLNKLELLLNGALLYFQERSESESALNEQALSAAVAAAEFTASTDAAERIFNDPSRSASIAAAARHIKDLNGFYFINGESEISALSPAADPWSLDGLSRPNEPVVMPIAAGASAHPYIVALAPAGAASFIAVRLDAAPMIARLAARRDHIVLISCIAGVIGALLAWHVAHRIVRDLHQNRAALVALEAGGDLSAGGSFRIREARDLADAVWLMDASQRAAANRLELETQRQNRERSPSKAAITYNRSTFKPVSLRTAGADIVIRLMGETSAGSFFVICESKGRAVIVVGECAAQTQTDSLALALAARDFLETHLLDGDVEACLALAKAAYGVTALNYAEWRTDDNPPAAEVLLLAVTDPETRRAAKRFSETDPDAAPADVLDGIEALLKPTGVFAAITRRDSDIQALPKGEDDHDEA